jgi:hypothetical protein
LVVEELAVDVLGNVMVRPNPHPVSSAFGIQKSSANPAANTKLHVEIEQVRKLQA